MTLGEVYRQGEKALSASGIDGAPFEASALFQKAFGLDRQQRVIFSSEAAPPDSTEKFFAMVKERAGKRPLQYILGSWPFMGLSLSVGEGVLIPREETELLVRTAADFLKGRKNPAVIDLCSGSGAVALAIASLYPGAEIVAAELYGGAFSYLEKNIKASGFTNVKPVRLDVLKPPPGYLQKADCITANPPYVKTGDMAALQAEVQREPVRALDGGADGLSFYRALADLWVPMLKKGGLIAAETGDGQARPVMDLLCKSGCAFSGIYTDFNGIERVAAAEAPLS